MTLELLVDRVHVDPPGLTVSEWYQALVNVEGDFAVRLPSGVLIEDSHWCVVELAHALRGWLRTADEDFVYTSMDDEEEGLLWFRREAPDVWRVGSVRQRFEAEETFSQAALAGAARAFVERVENLVRTGLRIDLAQRFPEYEAELVDDEHRA